MGSLADGPHLMRAHEKEIICLGGAVISIKKPFEYSVDLGSRNYAPVLMTFRDTSRLAEEKASLEALGESLGEPKVDISPWSKARMDLLLEGDKELFERYAITDCRIALKWFFNVAETNESVLKIDSMPPTTGSASAEGLIAYLGEEDFAEKFCVEKNKFGSYVPKKMRAGFESYPIQCYLGGANQSYQLGRVEGTILDLDLSGAYTGAMGIIPEIDWDVAPIANSIFPWTLTDPMCFALVRFRFPEGTLFPCLPVGTDHGLIYPLSCWDRSDGSLEEGVYVTGPEMKEALLMGAKIQVLSSMRFVTKGPLLSGYVGELAALRSRFDKTDPRNTAAKMAANSLYGKFGQGLKNRYTNEEIFTKDEIEQGKKMPPSPVTLPHAAATVTGIVRAVLNAMVLEASTLGTVLSATTDGIMLHMPDVPLSEHVYKGKPHIDPPRALLEACEKHPSVQLLMQGRKNIGQDPKQWLEVKYAGNEAYTVKTRMNWIGWHGETVNQAMVGLKKSNVKFAEVVAVREKRLPRFHTEPSLFNIADVVAGKAKDITSTYMSREVNLTPDWKRKFANDGTSVPFASMEEWAQFRRKANTLKSSAFPDMVVFTEGERYRTPEASTAAVHRGVLHRIVLGYERFRLPTGMTYTQVCEVLKINPRSLARLRRERMNFKPLPIHPDIEKIQSVLGLW
jgi:hypothetical protein